MAVGAVLATGGVAAWSAGLFHDERQGRSVAGQGLPRVSRELTTRPLERVRLPKPPPSPRPINKAFPGLTTFRGNATRTYYGRGPVPRDPAVLWQYPVEGAMCAMSEVQGEPRKWCGTGWTGQPNVIQHPNGRIEVREGAYDDRYHFLDGRTGEPVRPDLVTGDLAKGSATSDPDGFPLYYAGSRDDLLRIVALDRSTPTVLWSLDSVTSVPVPRWNSDWDGAPLVVGDYLLEGGENSWFYVVKLNRRYDDGLVQVEPKVVMKVPAWDDRLLGDLGDGEVSIEGSVAFDDGVAYFANSGGLVQGWDISDVLRGGTEWRRVFRFWTGDDTDASIAIDEEGFLYVGVEYQRKNARDREVGQILKLDPNKPRHPLVWNVHATDIGFEGAGGTWGTPALYGPVVYDTTAAGDVLAIDRESGRVVWREHLAPPTIGSPVPVDGTLLVGDCAGVLHAFDVSKPRHPRPRWTLQLPGCIESTPAVWRGMVYVGTRAGKIYGIGAKSEAG